MTAWAEGKGIEAIQAQRPAAVDRSRHNRYVGMQYQGRIFLHNAQNGLRHVLSWSKLGLEPKFHDPGTFGGFGKRGQTDTHTRFMFYKYRLDSV